MVHVFLLGSCSLSATLPVDVDCPESQEVLVSREVCLQFGIGCLSGAAIAPFSSGCPHLPVSGGGCAGPQPASHLFCEQAWWRLEGGEEVVKSLSCV